MNGKDVREIEVACEEALAPVVSVKFDLSPRIVQMMAKAAVAVLEAAVEVEQG